jgi:hypothetical protein
VNYSIMMQSIDELEKLLSNEDLLAKKIENLFNN